MSGVTGFETSRGPLPPMQASWRGEAVREVRAGLALAPWSSKSLTHSTLPAEQASHSGVLPSTFLASTWDALWEIEWFNLFQKNHNNSSTKSLLLCLSFVFVFTPHLFLFCLPGSPGLQRPAAAARTGSVLGCRPHAAVWWSPPPPCWLKLHFGWGPSTGRSGLGTLLCEPLFSLTSSLQGYNSVLLLIF